MTAEIASYLSSGYSAMQVLQMLEKTFPHIARGAKSALQLGRSAEDIVKLLSKLRVNDLKKIDKNAEHLNFTTPLERANKGARSQEQNPLYQGAQDLAKLGALAGGVYGAGKLIQGLNPQQFPEAAPNNFQSTIQPSTAQPQESIVPIMGQAVPASSLQPSNQQISNTESVPQTELSPQKNTTHSSLTPQNSISLIEQMGIGPQIQTMQSAGNNPEAISAAVRQTMKPHQIKWLDEQIKAGKAKPLPDLITDFLGQSQASPENVARPPPIEETTKLKPQKGEFVATPNGEVGELKDIKKTEGLIEEGGKLHKAKISDLKGPGETEIEVVKRLLEMPEVDTSSIIAYWSYDHEDKELFAVYHNGESYKYKDVPEELAEELEKASVVPKSKGKKLFGEFSQEQEAEFSEQAGKNIVSRGATLSKLFIQHPKYKKAKKGEPPNPFYIKLRKGYDYWTKLRA